jgi:hypothetical protein
VAVRDVMTVLPVGELVCGSKERFYPVYTGRDWTFVFVRLFAKGLERLYPQLREIVCEV